MFSEKNMKRNLTFCDAVIVMQYVHVCVLQVYISSLLPICIFFPICIYHKFSILFHRITFIP